PPRLRTAVQHRNCYAFGRRGSSEGVPRNFARELPTPIDNPNFPGETRGQDFTVKFTPSFNVHTSTATLLQSVRQIRISAVADTGRFVARRWRRAAGEQFRHFCEGVRGWWRLVW